MTESTDLWYAPVPYDTRTRRLALDFNLRSADRFFGERVVPGARRVWFVRELSWALGALALMPELSGTLSTLPTPTDVAHGIEALASRLTFFANDEQEFATRRLFGRRAFQRDGKRAPWAFAMLCQREHYVRNTHRIAITTALRAEALGLVTGRRFNSMRPVGLGLELAEHFLAQQMRVGRGKSLKECLRQWIERDAEESATIQNRPGIRETLGPETPSDAERHCVARALFSEETSAALTRRNLAKALLRYRSLPSVEQELVPALKDLGREAQALDLVAARAFGTMFDDVIALAFATHASIHCQHEPVLGFALSQERSVCSAHDALRASAEAFEQAAKNAGLSAQPELSYPLSLVHALRTQPLEKVLLTLLKQAPALFEVQENSVGRGPLFDRLTQRLTSTSSEELLDEDSDEDSIAVLGDAKTPTQRTFGIEGFLSLIHDCRVTAKVLR